jgi:hypothetical protein
MRTISETCIAMAIGLVLASCAGTGPQNPSATSTANVNTPPAPPAAANSGSTKLPKGFRRVTKDGQEYICEREASTASRTEIVETCLTAAEYESRTKNGQDFLQGMKGIAMPPPVGGKAFTPGF